MNRFARLSVSLAALGLGLAPALAPASTTLVVRGDANVYGAGHAAVPSDGILPPSIAGLEGGMTVQVSVLAGQTSCASGQIPFLPPDGGNCLGNGSTDIAASGGISGYTDNVQMPLVGVFLTDAEPVDPAPAGANWGTEHNRLSYSPPLRQVFFIGDGVTGTTPQTFVAPAGATRLFIGYADGAAFLGPPSFYGDNGGGATIDVEVSNGLDFGDAPASYRTKLARDGARHAIVLGGPILGATVDDEADGQPQRNAQGDDRVNVGNEDDEDGVTLGDSGICIALQDCDATIVVQNGPAKIDAWVDFDGDGRFDNADERVLDRVDVVDGTNDLSFQVPAGAVAGDTFARFRLSTDGVRNAKGFAPDGEVEDVKLSFVTQPALRITNNPSTREFSNGKHTPLAFRVELSPRSDVPVTVGYRTRPNTATSNVDFIATNGVLTFQPGEFEKTVSVVVIGDNLAEADETFGLELRNPVNADIGDGQAVGTIRDDD